MSESFAAGNPPKYEELATELRKRIAGGVYAESGFLPQERMLSEEFKVSRNTMRNALELLVKENLITKVQGRGTVINSFHNEVGEYVVLN
ncbi:MAG: GntR family transcriptional regulator, partial [Victivallaceae bacterium]